MGNLCSDNENHKDNTNVSRNQNESTENESKENESKDSMTKMREILKHGIVSIDHFEKIYRLIPKYDGCPNLRQIKGFYVFGTGQPTRSALKSLLNDIKSLGMEKVIWFNMRSEPVLYVNNLSFAPREPTHLTENIPIPKDLTIDNINTLQIELQNIVKKKISTNNSTFTYNKLTYALLPADRKPFNVNESVTDIDTYVLALQNLYKVLNNEINDIELDLHRLPINDERAPDPEDIDTLVDIITKDNSGKTAFVFNCQMGKGRTTGGAIICCLIKKRLGHYYKDLNSKKEDLDEIKWLYGDLVQKNDEIKNLETKKLINNKISKENMLDGNYAIINNLLKYLENDLKLTNITQIKDETDEIINSCNHLTNMRLVIYLSKVWYENETIERRNYWKHISHGFLERYYVLIAFNAYLHFCWDDTNKTLSMSYQQWLGKYPKVNEIIGTEEKGPLSEFNWD